MGGELRNSQLHFCCCLVLGTRAKRKDTVIRMTEETKPQYDLNLSVTDVCSGDSLRPILTRRRFVECAGGGILAASLFALNGCSAPSAGASESVSDMPPLSPDAEGECLAPVVNSRIFVEKIRSLETKDTFTFLWFADSHAQYNDERLGKAYEYIEQVFSVAEILKPDMITNTGDILNGGEDRATFEADMRDVASLLATSPVPFLAVRGNHDDNSLYTANTTGNYVRTEVDDTAYVAEHLIKPSSDSDCVYDEKNPNSCYYYRDFPSQKIRVIVLDDSDIPYTTHDDILDYIGLGDYGFSARQVEWFANDALVFDEKGWGIIIDVHINFCDTRPYGLRSWGTVQTIANSDQMWQILCAFTHQETGCATNDQIDFCCNVTYDFRDNPSHEIICCLNGHTHRDSCAFIDGIFNVTIRQFTARIQPRFDAVVVDRTTKMIYIRTYDTPSVVSAEWDIDYGNQRGTPSLQVYCSSGELAGAAQIATGFDN